MDALGLHVSSKGDMTITIKRKLFLVKLGSSPSSSLPSTLALPLHIGSRRKGRRKLESGELGFKLRHFGAQLFKLRLALLMIHIYTRS